jgi:hypothetical protein
MSFIIIRTGLVPCARNADGTAKAAPAAKVDFINVRRVIVISIPLVFLFLLNVLSFYARSVGILRIATSPRKDDPQSIARTLARSGPLRRSKMAAAEA